MISHIRIRARSRLYRSQILQVNTKYALESSRRDLQIQTFAPFSWDPSRGIRLGEEIYENEH